MKKFKNYMSPKIDDLRSMGFVPEKTSPELQRALFTFFCERTPYSKLMTWYMNFYGNTHDLARKSIAIYSYGITGDNLNQFGGETGNLLYDVFLNILKTLIASYIKFSGDTEIGRKRFNRNHVFAFTDMMIDDFMDEAKDQSLRALGQANVPYRGFKPPRKKRVRGSEYRIMKYADMYE